MRHYIYFTEKPVGVNMIPVEEFLTGVRDEKQTSLLVLACSGNKRSDSEIERLLNNFSYFEDRTLVFDDKSLRLMDNFRKCTKAEHETALNPSKMYPAYLRYCGFFYNSVWELGGIEVWKKVVDDGWRVLILSAFYGFLRITDPINDYSLRISELSAKCKRILLEILRSIIKTNGIDRVYFLTSKEYSKPFRKKMIDLYRVILLDSSNNKIIGSYGKEYYSEAGRLFASLVTGKDFHGKTHFVELEGI
ncbi:peroxide stress protein YaaA [Archaeoglobus sp.]